MLSGVELTGASVSPVQSGAYVLDKHQRLKVSLRGAWQSYFHK